jgi:hypothetical protein
MRNKETTQNIGRPLIDLQRDFLQTTGHLSVGEKQVENVIDFALRLIAVASIYGFSPIFIVNQYAVSDRIENFVRHHSAMAGSAGLTGDNFLQMGYTNYAILCM